MRAAIAPLALLLLFAPASAVAGQDAADKKTIKRIVREIAGVPSWYAKDDPPLKFKSLPPFSAKKLAAFGSARKRATDKEREAWKANKEHYARDYPLRAALFAAAAEMKNLQTLNMPMTLAAGALPQDLFQNGRVKDAALLDWKLGCVCEWTGKPGTFPTHAALLANASKARAPLLQLQAPAAAATLKLEQVLRQMQDAAQERTRETSKRWQADFDFALARVETNLVFLFEYNYLLAQIRADQLPVLSGNQDGWQIVPRPRISVRESVAKKLAKERGKLLQRIQTDYAGTPWAYFAERESRRELGMAWSATPR
jgi:hypothetical protein